MSVRTVEVSGDIPASPEAMWAILENHEGYHRWGPWVESTLTKEGRADRNGVGAVRRLKADARTILFEEITGFEAPRRMTYTLQSGLPLKTYDAEMTLAPSPSGTTLKIRSQFEAKIPGTGWLVANRMKHVYADILQRLAEYAKK